MSDPATATARLFSSSLQSVSPRHKQAQRCARRLLGPTDSFDRFVPSSLVNEATASLLAGLRERSDPVILFMDRLGGGDGGQCAASLIKILGESTRGASFIHISFSTPSRGLGSLLRGNLTRAGAETGVLVDVVAHNRPAEGMVMTREEADSLVADCDLVVTFAPGGSAGLIPGEELKTDPLLTRSHVNVLSFPDPESLVADLPRLSEAIARDPEMDSIRFWAQIHAADGATPDLGRCHLGEDGDADSRLWVLLDNAKRHRYSFTLEPMLEKLPTGVALLCPCSAAMSSAVPGVRIDRIVPAGNRLLVVGTGRNV